LLPFPELLKDECLKKDTEKNKTVLTGRHDLHRHLISSHS
jgi:hypothetical protein